MTAISKNKVVSLTYELKVQNEEGEQTLVETADKENPMVFLFGVSGLPDKFEQNLEGKNEGDTFSFALEAEEGYGEYDQNALVNIPKNVFEIDGKIDEDMLQEGNYIPMSDNEGNQMQGRVVEMSEDVGLAGIDRLSKHYRGRPYTNRDRGRVNAWIDVDRWHGWGQVEQD